VPPTVDRPPDELAAGKLALLRYRGGEAPVLARAVSESLEHLRPWMPWAVPTPTEESLADFVRRALDQWETGESFNYWMRDVATAAFVGGAGLHARLGPAAIEIGYWVHVGWTRRGFASAAARALTSAGFGLSGVRRVEIHCDVANVASAGVPRRLGYRLERIVDDEAEPASRTGRSMIWFIDADSWSAR